MTLLDQDDILEAKGPKRVSPFTIPMLMPNGPAAAVGLAVGAKAGVHAPVSACASGAEAIRWGLDLLHLGRADMVVVGGTEACVHPLPMAGFAAMRAMSTRNDEPERASRPFDKGRDGFVLGEGAAALVLERADSAAARGATIYARLAGAGGTADGYDLVAPHPEGEGAGRAIAAAIRDAGLTAADIGHVNAHATSTPIGDTAEANAIRNAIGDHPLVTATKSQTGHLLGAAGALESVFTILALRDQIVPATANLENPDDDAAVQALDIVRREPRKATFTAALNDSFGFGGHNMALVFTTA
jgi:3-oxoacyl-[acyl-carrier-protein] synthase II